MRLASNNDELGYSEEEQETLHWIAFFNTHINFVTRLPNKITNAYLVSDKQTVGSLLLYYFLGMQRAKDWMVCTNGIYHPTGPGIQKLFECLCIRACLPDKIPTTIPLPIEAMVMMLRTPKASASFYRRSRMKTFSSMALVVVFIRLMLGDDYSNEHVPRSCKNKNLVTDSLIVTFMELLGSPINDLGVFDSSSKSVLQCTYPFPKKQACQSQVRRYEIFLSQSPPSSSFSDAQGSPFLLPEMPAKRPCLRTPSTETYRPPPPVLLPNPPSGFDFPLLPVVL